MSDPIVVFDEYGRRIEVTRDEWRRKVLLPNVQKAWNDPDALYEQILRAVEDGFYDDVERASRRLAAIDPNHERGATMRAIVLLRTERFADAERVLREYIARHGESAVILANLAAALERQRLSNEAEKTLWRAVELDPNQDNVVTWLAAQEHERGGEAAYLAVLDRLAREHSSWRAKLWLARAALERRDLAAALELYRDVIVAGGDEPGVLTQISGDLGRAGFTQEIADLVLPIYDPQRHDVLAGFNCLEALLQLRDRVRGEALLHRLMLLHLPPYHEALMRYSSAFAELAKAPTQREPLAPDSLELLRLDVPIWLGSLGDTSWLLPRGSSIAIYSLADVTPRLPLNEGEALKSAENRTGQLARGLSLHLADVLRFRTASTVAVLQPIIQGGGVVLEGTEPDVDVAQALIANAGAELLITGSISEIAGELRVRLALWRTNAKEALARIERAGRTLEPLLRELERELIAAAGGTEGGESWLRPLTAYAEPYLFGLAQLLIIGLSAQEFLPRDSLYGERQMLRWFIDLALSDDGAPVPLAMVLSGLASSRRRGSDAWREFEREALRLFESVSPQSPLYRLTPALFALFDRGAELEARRNELMRDAGDDYVRWLASVETLFTAAPGAAEARSQSPSRS